MLSTDLLTGSLTYENKFWLDAKPIEGGVRVLVVFIAFESDSFSLPTGELCAYSTKERDRKSSKSFPKEEEALEYQKGERKHGTMHANASGLSDQDIIDIANYFESVK